MQKQLVTRQASFKCVCQELFTGIPAIIEHLKYLETVAKLSKVVYC